MLPKIRMKSWAVALGILILILLVASWVIPIGNIRGCTANSQTHTKSLLSGFIIALKVYRTEYNRFPVEALSSGDEHQLQRMQGKILRVLLGEDETLNPRKIVFFDPPLAKDRKRGLYRDEKGEPFFVDSWGEPFYFMFDINGEGKIPNPDPRPDEPRELGTTVIGFSAGPDRDPDTWKDNVASWR